MQEVTFVFENASEWVPGILLQKINTMLAALDDADSLPPDDVRIDGVPLVLTTFTIATLEELANGY